jgi:hypothetical protein
MNFFSRFQETFFNPRKTFAALAERPVWVDMFIVVFVAIGLFSYLTAPYSQKDTLQMWKDNVKMQERLGKENFQKRLDMIANASPARSLPFPLATFLIGLFFSSLIILVLGRLVSVQGGYRQVLAAVVHANLIDKILGNAVRLVLVLTRKAFLQTSTGLALFFPQMEITSTSYVILAQFDFFQLWMFGILAYGLAAIFKVELKKALFVSYGFWALKAVFTVALSLLAMSFMR